MICRLQKLWKEEVAKVGLEKASLVRVIVRFQRTRLILSAIAGVIAMVAAFLGPVNESELSDPQTLSDVHDVEAKS